MEKDPWVVQKSSEGKVFVITDTTIEAVADFLSSSGREELSSLKFYQRDFASDLSYPACVILEDGAPEEDEVIRGQWTIPISVVLITIPEGDEAATTHRNMAKAINELIGDDDAVIEFLGRYMQCNDSAGGEGATEPSDGYRQTTFSLEIKGARAS